MNARMSLLAALAAVLLAADGAATGAVEARIRTYVGVPCGQPWIDEVISSPTEFVSDQTTFYLPSFPQSYGSVEAWAVGGTSPYLSLDVEAHTVTGLFGDRLHAGGEARLTYYYRVVAPGLGNTSVPVTWSYAGGLTTNLTGGTRYYAYGWMNLRAGVVGSFEYGAGTTNSGSLIGEHTATASIMANTWYDAYINLQGWVASNDGAIYVDGARGAGTGRLHAFIDPTLEIDPTWLAAHPNAQIEFNTVTPEPASIALLALGGLGLLAKRRRVRE